MKKLDTENMKVELDKADLFVLSLSHLSLEQKQEFVQKSKEIKDLLDKTDRLTVEIDAYLEGRK